MAPVRGKRSVLVPATLLVAACLLATACGNARTGPPVVSLSVSAPTSGVTVGVRSITVAGTVSPANAFVSVAGRLVHVRKGKFQQPLLLLRRLTHITVRARAAGYHASSTVLAVRYSQRLRPAPAISQPAAAPSSPPSSSRAIARGEQAAVNQATGPAVIASCTNETGNLALCTCLWQHMSAAGYGSLAKLRALGLSWRRSFRIQGVIVYPPRLKDAMLSCAQSVGQP